MADEELDWGDGAPRSRRFGDVYFSVGDGLAESRAVFLQGCGLPEAWAGRDHFVVGELGFGTGLNVAALLDLWRRDGPGSIRGGPPPTGAARGARLHLVSIEAFPIDVDQARRALSVWPELSEPAEALRAAWPDGRRGFHRIDLPGWNATLDLAVMEVGPALEAWSGRADAWFLDGFSPAANPAMWTPEVLALVAARSAPGARAATFTVAGAVRRGLQAVGFAVDKRPGHGRKKERLEARLPGAPPSRAVAPRVAIVGGGIAGASLVRAFRAEGCATLLVEAEPAGSDASGNPAALVAPRLDAGFGLAARLSAQAHARAVALYAREVPQAILARGALQLERRPQDRERFARIAAWDGFPPDAVAALDPAAVADALKEPVGPGALALDTALVVEPATVLDAWSAPAERLQATVARLEASPSGWRLLDAGGAVIAEAETVVLACAMAASGLAGLAPLRPVRGQVDWVEGVEAGPASAWGGYAVPTRAGVLFGATHVRGDEGTEVREDDSARNLDLLAVGRPDLARRVREAGPLAARAAVRATTADHLPLAGGVPDSPGLFVLAGLGGRGFTLAPLLAEHVVALAVGAPSPLPAEAAVALSPARFGGGQ